MTSVLTIACCGQIDAHTPQPAHITSSTTAFFLSRSQVRAGQRKILVHSRLQPQASPRHRASSTFMSNVFFPSLGTQGTGLTQDQHLERSFVGKKRCQYSAGCRKIKWVTDGHFCPDRLADRGNVNRWNHVFECTYRQTRMRLKPRHGCPRIVQNNKGDVRPVVLSVDERRNHRMIKCGIAADSQDRLIQTELAQFGKTAGQSCSGTHGMKRVGMV